MVVVNNARKIDQQNVDISVTSVLPTTAGKMISANTRTQRTEHSTAQRVNRSAQPQSKAATNPWWKKQNGARSDRLEQC